MPKASALRFHQSNGSQLDKTLLALRKQSRVLRHRRVSADCFGANPVASALGDPARRDPGEAVRTYHEGPHLTLKTGTFYLAGNRNFLFGSDKYTAKAYTGSVRCPASRRIILLVKGRIISSVAKSIGLCATCQHVQRITSDRGSIFYLCKLSAVDPRFPKYPGLPVLSCSGYEEEQQSSAPPKVNGGT